MLRIGNLVFSQMGHNTVVHRTNINNDALPMVYKKTTIKEVVKMYKDIGLIVE